MTESWRTLKLPLSPTRKFSPQQIFSLTGRTTFGNLGNRISTPSPRCPTPNTSRPGTAYSIRNAAIEGMSPTKLKNIYKSKCKDLDIPENPNQEARFFKACEKSIKNRQFSIKDQELGENSAKVIGEILQNSLDFSRVILSANHLQDSGALKLSQLISLNSNIIHVDVSSNELTNEGMKAFIDLWLNSVSLISLDISTYNGVHRNRIGASAAESLSILVNTSKILIFLEINETSLNDSGLEKLIIGLSNNKSLLKLGLAGNNISHRYIEDFCKVISDSNIEDLNLSNNKISDAGCKSLADLLVYNDFSCKLKRLDISKNDITFKGINGIFLAVRYNPTLTSLNCEANPLGSPAGQSLHFLMMNNYALCYLNLNSTKLKNEGLNNLSKGLAANKSLTNLNLGNNEIKDLGIIPLCEALCENEILKILDLSFNCIRDGSHLGNMLKKNMGLESLNLKENKIKEHSGSLFVEASLMKTNLIKLNLEGNHISLKHLEEIKLNIKRNEVMYTKGKSPTILKRIEKLQKGTMNTNLVHEEINKKKQEKIKVLNKVSQLRLKLTQMKNMPDNKLDELQNEYKELRQTSYLLSVELDELQKEILKFKLMLDKADRGQIDEIGKIVQETKQLERKSKNY